MNFITFTSESVQAILDGAKTQTRRVILPQPPSYSSYYQEHSISGEFYAYTSCGLGERLDLPAIRCSFGKPGSRLWVKEPWRLKGMAIRRDDPTDYYVVQYRDLAKKRVPNTAVSQEQYDRFTVQNNNDFKKANWIIGKTLDGLPAWAPPSGKNWDDDYPLRWRNSRYMPRWASRLTIELVAVRVECVDHISDADVKAEGFEDFAAFERAFNALNEKRGFPTYIKPWVWVLEFRRAET